MQEAASPGDGQRARAPLQRRLAGMAFGLVVGLVAAEFVSCAFVLLTTGKLFYTMPASDGPPRSGTGSLFEKAAAIHPFWASSARPGSPIFGSKWEERLELMILDEDKRPVWSETLANNCGFAWREDYPTPRRSDEEVLIGFFGGSVAKLFCLIGEDELIAELQKDPLFRDRVPRLVNLAKSGSKQPSQANILGYFLTTGQPLDVVVNLDGFNEAALSVQNWHAGIDVSFPRQYPRGFAQLVRRPDRKGVQWQLDVIDNSERLDRLAVSREQRWSATLHLVNGVRASMTQAALDDLLGNPPEVSAEATRAFASVDIDDTSPDENAIAERIADQWMRSSLTMHGMAAAHGATYVQILQPNQYYTKRAFDDAEREIAIVADHPYSRGVPLVYPLLLDRIPDLRAAGVHSVSGVDVLDDEPQRVYADACCHYTDVGNQVLARFVAATILDALRDD